MDTLIEANKERLLDTKNKMFETINNEIDINKNRELSAMRQKFSKKLEIFKKDDKISEDVIDSLNEFFLEELQTYDTAITADTRVIIEDQLISYDNKADLLRMNIIRRKTMEMEEVFCDISNTSMKKTRKHSSESISSNTSEDPELNVFFKRFNLSDNTDFTIDSSLNFNSEDEYNSVNHCNSDNDSDTEVIHIISKEQELNLKNFNEIKSICSENGIILSKSGKKKSKQELISELLVLEDITL